MAIGKSWVDLGFSLTGEDIPAKFNKHLEAVQKTVKTTTTSMNKDWDDSAIKYMHYGKEIGKAGDAAQKGFEAIKKQSETAARVVGTSLKDMRAEYKQLGEILNDPGQFSIGKFGVTEEALEKMGEDYRKLGEDIKVAEEELRQLNETMGQQRKAAPVSEGYGDAYTQQVEAAIEATKKEAEEQEKQLDQQKNFGKRMTSEIMKVGMLSGSLGMRFARAAGGPFIAMAAGAWVAQKALKAISKAIESTIKSIDNLVKSGTATRAFESLGAQAGIAFEGMAQAARVASGYAIDTYDITITQNKLLTEGYKDVAGSVVELSGLARVMGNAFGVDAAGQLQSLIGALKEADAETLETEYGFKGVTEAIRAEARAMGVGVDALDENRKASIALGVVLPQLQGRMEDLGGATLVSAANLKGAADEFGRTWDAIKRDVGIGFLSVVGMDPSALAAWNEFNDALSTGGLVVAALQEQAESGILDPDAVNRAAQEWDDYFKSITKRIQDAGRNAETFTKETSLAADALWRVERISQNLDPSIPPAALKSYGEAEAGVRKIADAMDWVNQRSRDWAIDLSEVMSVEDAKALAEEIGRNLKNQLAMSIQETGDITTVESQAIINIVEGQVLAMLGRLQTATVETMRGIASDMIGTAYKEYQSFMGDIRQTAEDMALRLLPEANLQQLSDKADEIEQQLLGVGYTPGGQTLGQRQAWNQVTTGIEEVSDAQQRLNDLTDDWFIDLAEVMPLDEARQYAEVYRRMLISFVEATGGDIGDLTTAQAAIAISQIDALIDADIARRESRDPAAMAKRAKEDAEDYALGLSEYLTFEQVEDFAAAIERDIADWGLKYILDLNSTEARYALDQVEKKYEAIGDAIKDANKETKASIGSMKKWASATLLASQGLGAWSQAFTMEHGGRDPLQQYQKHEEPLVAAMVDKLWGDQFAAREGRAATDAEWRQHWYEQWAPLEAYPGGPIGKATGPLADEARKILTSMGFEDLGQIYKDDWDKRNALITEMDLEKTQIEKVTESLGLLDAYILSMIPTGDEDDDEDGEVEDGVTVVEKIIAEEIKLPRGGVQSFQHGGFTRTGGLALLHPDEVVIPLDKIGSYGPEEGPGTADFRKPKSFQDSLGGLADFIDLNVMASFFQLDSYLMDLNLKFYDEVLPSFDMLIWGALDAASALQVIPGLIPPPPPTEPPPPSLQHGGFTKGSGLAFLHPNEVIMPLNRMIDMLGMGGRGGGLSIGSLSIPVSISGGSSLRPADVQVAITNAIRGRAGTELVRAGRRIGL